MSLADVFSVLKASVYRGVEGVMVVDSGRQGPVVGLTIMTHGNEPCGLEVVKRLLDGGDVLMRGKVILCLNNLKAAETYFAAGSAQARRQTRFVDINMNRLPKDVLNGADGALYEVARARALKPVWDEFDFALDIHSTEQASVPMLITGPATEDDLLGVLPVKVVIRDIVEKQLRYPAMAFYREGCVSVGMEAGSHEQPEAGISAWDTARAFLQYAGVMGGAPGAAVKQDIYRVREAVIFPDESYELVKVFPLFEPVKRGDILARSVQGEEIVCPVDGVAIFAPVTTKPVQVSEEVMFLCTREISG